MVNTLFLPELREMLAEQNAGELREFSLALHPSRTAEYMDGLDPVEAWQVLRHADPETRVPIFGYLPHERQIEIIESQDRGEVAALVAEIPSDDRVDILSGVDDQIVTELMQRLSPEDRREIQRLSQYPDNTAGSLMATEFVRLDESLTVSQAIHEVGRQIEEYETIYYLFIVDSENHLRGIVSIRKLLASLKKPDTRLSEIMETSLTTVDVMEETQTVAQKVARMDLLAIPVLDSERHIVGIITHDDVLDVLQEDNARETQRIAAVEPLEDTYLRTHIMLLSWKRGIWLGILFLCALLTALALQAYESSLQKWAWLVPFIPLVISSGGNSGSQSATLVITALSRGDVRGRDWKLVAQREVIMGLTLGAALAVFGYLVAVMFPSVPGFWQALVVPVTLLAVVVCGTVTGSMLPLIFKQIGWDPALMSNPFVAGIIDILGIIIYMGVAAIFLAGT